MLMDPFWVYLIALLTSVSSICTRCCLSAITLTGTFYSTYSFRSSPFFWAALVCVFKDYSTSARMLVSSNFGTICYVEILLRL